MDAHWNDFNIDVNWDLPWKKFTFFNSALIWNAIHLSFARTHITLFGKLFYPYVWYETKKYIITVWNWRKQVSINQKFTSQNTRTRGSINKSGVKSKSYEYFRSSLVQQRKIPYYISTFVINHFTKALFETYFWISLFYLDGRVWLGLRRNFWSI